MSCEQRVWNVITYIVDFALQCDISVEHTYTCTCTNVCMYLLLSTMLELDHDILSSLTFLGHVKGKSSFNPLCLSLSCRHWCSLSSQ